MTIEASYFDTHETVSIVVPTGGLSAGEVIQLPDGRAGYVEGLQAILAGDRATIRVKGKVRLPKTASIVLLSGGKSFWDHSANKGHFKPVNDRDFYLGVVVGDAASTDTEYTVDLNVEPVYIADLSRDAFTTANIGTAAAGAAGFGGPKRYGGANKFLLTSTNEAQKVDALSRYGFAPGAKAIVEFEINNVTNGAGGAQDLSVGIADGTHATDADTIAQSAFIHMNGNDLNIYAECDDGTNETNATDTTIDAVAGTPFEVWIDCRDLTSLKFYIDGVRVLSATTFSIAAAASTFKLLAHLEKTVAADVFDADVNFLRARLQN
jgi:predicted RecA/RadA family phage recombinase